MHMAEGKGGGLVMSFYDGENMYPETAGAAPQRKKKPNQHSENATFKKTYLLTKLQIVA